MLYDCSECKSRVCMTGTGKAPANCPMRAPGYDEKIRSAYAQKTVCAMENAAQTACGTKEDRDLTPRIKVLIEYMKKMGYKKIGIIFCAMVFSEMDWLSRILRKCGFEVVSACCLNGGTNITEHGVELPEPAVKPGYDPACNPIGQARLMNAQHTEFNIVSSLCAGHDTLAFRYSEAPCSLLSIKDVSMEMCPINALHLYPKYPELLDPDPVKEQEK